MLYVQKQPLNAELLFRSRELGSLASHEVLSEMSEYLGAAIASLYNLYDPDRVIITGYQKDADAFVIENAISEAKSRIVSRFSRDIHITRAKLANDLSYQAISTFVLTILLNELF